MTSARAFCESSIEICEIFTHPIGRVYCPRIELVNIDFNSFADDVDTDED